MYDIIAQALGILGMTMNILSYQGKSQRSVILMQMVGAAFFTANMFMLEAWSGFILNALGTVDIVPLTGVTFPFLSNGGSSMIASWGLLAFVKAADTRQNASFAVRLLKRGGEEEDE